MDIQFYVGLDFHKNVAELCIQDGRGAIVDRARIHPQHVVKHLSNRQGCHIGIEASGAVFDMAEKLKAAGHKVTVIHAGKFRGIGIGGKKTDRRDAEALATALRLGFVPEVRQKTLYSRRINSLLASRDLVVQTRTALTNQRWWRRRRRSSSRSRRSKSSSSFSRRTTIASKGSTRYPA
jgi:hypothetical protein